MPQWKSVRMLLGESGCSKECLPTPLSNRGDAGDTGNIVQDLRDDMDSCEEGMSWIGASPKMSFRFMQSSQLPSEWSLMPECQQDHTVLEDWACYSIHMRVTLGEGGGDQPSPSHAWSSSLILDMLQEGPEEQITEAVVLAPREAILFFGWWSHKEGLPLGGTRDVGFSLTGLTSWAGRAGQVEVTISIVQEGCHAIAEAVIEQRNNARGLGRAHGKMKVTKTPVTAYDIKEWM